MSAPDRAVDPFALTADPSAYVPSPERERALEQMLAALAAGAVPCLEGPTGIGKTLLLQLLAQRAADRFLPLYLPYPALATEEVCGLALGLLERRSGSDPETALLDLAADLALQGRPLLLLIDDAGSLPEASARGLARLVARAQGSLRIALAGIEGSGLLHASAAFGDSLLRVALHEGIADERLREYVTAQLELAGAPRSLREAFDDATVAEIGRLAAGNPRRLHIAAQTIARRALKSAAAPTLPVVEAPVPAPPEAPVVPPPADPAPADDAPVAAEPPRDPLSVSPAPTPARPLATEAGGPAGEYRYVRGRSIAERAAAARDAPRAGGARLPAAEVDLTLAALPARTEPAPPGSARGAAAQAARAAARPRAPSVIAVTLVAAASAVLGFGLASSFTRDHEGIAALLAPLYEREAELVPEAVSEVSPEESALPPAFPAVAEASEERIDVSINASPWATVEIDGEAVGETPLGGVPLSPGPHRFRLRFPDGSVSERVIEVDAENRAIVFE